jgi:hypothetical protein
MSPHSRPPDDNPPEPAASDDPPVVDPAATLDLHGTIDPPAAPAPDAGDATAAYESK